MSELTEMRCVPCLGGVPRLDEQEIKRLMSELNGWEVVEGHHLRKHYSFPDFRSGLELINRVGELAEREGHHPDISFGWGYAEIAIWTHKIDGLSKSDFVLAAKIDAL
jgi:4a-hydroxytetrahydrobiopterin dehydratase